MIILSILQKKRFLSKKIQELSLHVLYQISKSKQISDNVFNGNQYLQTLIIYCTETDDRANAGDIPLIASQVLVNLSKNETMQNNIHQKEIDLDIGQTSNSKLLKLQNIESIIYNTHPSNLLFSADHSLVYNPLLISSFIRDFY